MGSRPIGWVPAARETGPAALGETVVLAPDQYSALEGAEALLLVTEWTEFKSPDWERVGALLSSKSLYDGRNIWDPAQVQKLGFTYRGIGRA